MSTIKKKDERKKVTYVPSRYREVAEKISFESKRSTAESFLKDSTVQIPSSSRSQLKTSTPATKFQITSPHLDESIVPPPKRSKDIPCLKERLGPSSLDSVKKSFDIEKKRDKKPKQLKVPVSVLHEEENDDYNQLLADEETNLLYAQYLQVAFLESEAKYVLRQRSNSAMETLTKLLNLVSQLMLKVQSEKSELQLMSTVIKIHEHLQKQINILQPVFEIIPALAKEYEDLAKAVNVNKHKLCISDVFLPVTGDEGEMFELLKKTTDFITHFFEEFPNYEKLISAADAVKNYVDAESLITDALKRSLDLLQEAKELSFTEASLALNKDS